MKKAFEIEYKHKKVEIHIIDFVGEVRNINGTPDLFSLYYNSNTNDKGQYILATEAEINIYEDAYFNIDELKTVGETDILIKYFEGADLVWQGFALPDFFQTGITKPRVLRIVATDRLGVLKDIVNTSTATTPKEIIEECLLQTGLTLPLEIRSVDNYLTSTTIERERIEGISAYDVIRSFMVQFNSKIVQYKNKWWIVNKKLLEDGFLDQEIIDIDLVYLDGQREIKPTASEVSLFLEFGGSKKYPKNWNFENWDGANFSGWTSKNGFIQQKNNKQIIDYTLIGGVGGYYKANYGADTIETSLHIKTDGSDGNWFGNYYTKPHIESTPEKIPFKDDFVDITISVNFTTASTRALRVLPLIRIINTNPLQHEYFVIQYSGEVTRVGRGEINLDGIIPLIVEDSSDGSNPLEAVQSNWSDTFKVNTSALGMTRSTNADIRLLIFQPRLNYFSESDVDIFVHSAEFIFNKDEQTHKGLIFKTKQGGDKFSKVRETETTLFSDKINQGVNGYFYNYKYDDTSITNLPKEYLLQMTRQMADMFCSARDFYSFSGEFKVNPLARYRCGSKYFVLVGGQSKRKTASIEIEEIVSNEGLIRTDYIYTYFEDSKDNIKSIGTASGSGGVGGTGGGGGMTSSQLEMLTNLADWWKLDEEGNLYTEKNMYSQQGVSALGLGESGSGGGGVGDFDRLDAWQDYDSTKAGWVLSALLGYDLHTHVLSVSSSTSSLETRVTSLESQSGSGLTPEQLEQLANLSDWWKLDENGNLYTEKNLYSTKGVSALGLGDGGGSGGGGADMLDSWVNYTTAKANFYVPASLLVPFRSDTLSRLTSLESGSATSIVTTGSGNAITSLTKAGSVITATKGLSFALSTHTHTIAQITGLQGALDSKATQSDIDTAIDDLEIGGRNLLLNSNFKTTSFNGWSRTYGTHQITENGYLKTYTRVAGAARIEKSFALSEIGTFTFSIKVKTNRAITWQSWVGLSNLNVKIKPIEDDFEIHSITFSNTIAGNKIIRGYQANAPIGTTILIEWEKLEKGNKPTDSSPAPEDQVSDWSTTDVNSFSFIKNKPTQLSQFTDNIGVATHIANKANPHNVTTAQIGAVDLTTNQNIGGVKTFASGTASYNKEGVGMVVSTHSRLYRYLEIGQLSNGLMYLRGRTDKATKVSNILLQPDGGNVGIGTTSPSYKLDVSGTGRFTGNVTASTFIGALSGNASSATQLQTARTIAGVSFDGTANIAIPFANLASKPTTLSGYGITDAVTLNTAQTITGAKTFSTLLTASAGVNTPKVDFGNGFTIEPSGTELVFKFNGVIKQRMLSDGTILATGGLTALST